MLTRLWPEVDATRHANADVAHAIREFEPLSTVVRTEDKVGAVSLLVSGIEIIDLPIDAS